MENAPSSMALKSPKPHDSVNIQVSSSGVILDKWSFKSVTAAEQLLQFFSWATLLVCGLYSFINFSERHAPKEMAIIAILAGLSQFTLLSSIKQHLIVQRSILLALRSKLEE